MAKKVKFKIWVVVAFLLAYGVFAYASSSSVLISTGESNFEASMSSAIYDAIGLELLESVNFENLYEIKYNNSGEIVFVSADSFKLNFLAHSLATETLNFYDEYCERGVPVPLGAFSGIKMLSGIGRNVNLKLIKVTSVKVEFISDFDEAGINQTRQTLYLKITPDATIITPFKKVKKTDSVSVLICDNLIVGKVPQTYLNAKIVGNNN